MQKAICDSVPLVATAYLQSRLGHDKRMWVDDHRNKDTFFSFNKIQSVSGKDWEKVYSGKDKWLLKPAVFAISTVSNIK